MSQLDDLSMLCMCLLQEAGYPDINIICEKVAAEGETRFEDRYRLPIGISVNMTSFSAKLLTSTLYNPRNVLVFAQVPPHPCLNQSKELSFQLALYAAHIADGHWHPTHCPSHAVTECCNLFLQISSDSVHDMMMYGGIAVKTGPS
jgi:hypothetical protein